MGKSLSNLVLLTRASVILLLCVMMFQVWRTGGQWIRGVANFTSWFSPSPSEPEVDAHTLILQQVRGVSELTTAVLAMESVVPTHRDRTLGDYVIGTTQLLYIAYGEVRAGIDLSQLEPQDITLTDETLSIQLPPPAILDRKIDVERSQVYDYDRGFLGLGPDAAAELQTLAQRETLAQLVEAACEHNLLEQANERAIAVLSQLLTSTAPTQTITIQTQTASPGTCPSS